MAHTDKDQPWRITGVWRHRYWTSPRGHAKWKRGCRRISRAKARNDLIRGREPQPRYAVNFAYFD